VSKELVERPAAGPANSAGQKLTRPSPSVVAFDQLVLTTSFPLPQRIHPLCRTRPLAAYVEP